MPVIDHLPPDLADKLRSPEGGLLRPDIPWDEINSIPVVFGVQPGQYVPLVCRMMSSTMLTFFEEEEKDGLIINGIFGVPKDEAVDRFILDARRGNMAYTDPDPVLLANPGIFGELILPQGEQLYVACSDADNMFHRLRLPEWMHRFFALPPVSSAAIGLPGPDRQVYPALKSCPMGFSWAVVLAQAVHLTILDGVPGTSASTRIQKGGPCVIGPSSHAAYIDDYTGLGTDCELVNAHLQDVTVASADAGLPPKASKVKPAVPADPKPVDSLGLAFSRDGTVRPIPDNTRATIAATRHLLQVGACSGRALHRLLGSWTWNCLLCRPALSAMFSVYGFIGRFEHRRARLTPAVRQELAALVGLAPLLSVDLGSPVAERAYATDASFWGAGVCYKDIGAAAMDSMSTTGLPDAPAPLLECLSAGQWTTAISRPWNELQHINELEGRACVLGLRHLLRSQQLWGHRVIFACDSNVMVGALRKGRSSSWPINRVCRQAAAIRLSTGVLPTWYWCPTGINPADFPSRHRRG